MANSSPSSTEITEPDDIGKPRARWPWILLSMLVLGSVGYVLSITEDTIDVTGTATAPPLQLVSVESVSLSPQSVAVRAFAEVRPRWSAELRAAVSGRVTSVENSALAGEPVRADTTLLEIESSRYAAEVASAEQALKQANLELWRARNANIVARDEFKRADSKPPNDLALKLPQLDIAQSAVRSAEARLLAARKQLDDTKIVAPFSGYVTERFISPGQTINVGDQLVNLVDNSAFELEVELGRKGWGLLQKPFVGLKAQIQDQDGTLIAEAKIRRGGGFLDKTTRQYKIFLVIENASAKGVLSGDFVRVLLPGVTVSDALDIPASALTQEGYVWHVDTDDRLQRIQPGVLFRRQDRVIVSAPEGGDTWRVARTPLVSFLPGRRVRAQDAGN